MNDLAIFKPAGSAIDRMFNDVIDDFGKGFYDLGIKNRSLITTAEEKDDFYIIKAEIPGLSEDNIDITFDDGILTLTANYGEKKENEDFKYLREGKFTKSYRLPDIDSDKIDANISNGVLEITANKSEKAKPRKIKIKKS